MHGFAPVAVSSNGLFCAIVLLFLMLLFVIISIAACRWKMSRTLGLTMFALYFVFLVLRCATARAARSTQLRWAIWSRHMWTNTNMLGNIRKERT